MALRNFNGCKAIVRGDENQLLEVEILEHDRSQGLITLPAEPFVGATFEKALVLIQYGDEVYEFQGTVRRFAKPGQVDIALYREKTKQDRADKRFAIQSNATIENVYGPGLPKPLERPQRVTVLDISSSGALIRTAPGLLQLSTTFRLRMMMGQAETALSCCVVRIKNENANYSEYGCQFLSQQS